LLTGDGAPPPLLPLAYPEHRTDWPWRRLRMRAGVLKARAGPVRRPHPRVPVLSATALARSRPGQASAGAGIRLAPGREWRWEGSAAALRRDAPVLERWQWWRSTSVPPCPNRDIISFTPVRMLADGVEASKSW